MASLEYDVNMGDIARRTTMTVNLRGMHQYRVRMWIGIQLMKLAGWVMRMNFEVIPE